MKQPQHRSPASTTLLPALFVSLALSACLKTAPDGHATVDAHVAIPGVDLGDLSVNVHKDVGCSCCDGWMDYLRAQGVRVTSQEDPQLSTYQDSLGIPAEAHTCHTAVIDDDSSYVIGGHVPVEAIAKLLHDQPDAIGIVVLGMPADSPGMGGTPDDWRALEVKLISNEGELLPFAY